MTMIKKRMINYFPSKFLYRVMMSTCSYTKLSYKIASITWPDKKKHHSPLCRGCFFYFFKIYYEGNFRVQLCKSSLMYFAPLRTCCGNSEPNMFTVKFQTFFFLLS